MDAPKLLRAVVEADVVMRLEVRSGDHVVIGTPVARVWLCADDGPPGRSPGPDLAERVRSAVRLGYERTTEQDVAFGFRQLVDIAVKALSPRDQRSGHGRACHRASLRPRRALTGTGVGASVHCDPAGRPRLVLPDRDFRFRRALDGDIAGSYRDRSGETRTI